MRTKTTVSIDADLLRAVKIAAARTGRKEYVVFEEALRRSSHSSCSSASPAEPPGSWRIP
jgi:predicted transcriptional regulator